MKKLKFSSKRFKRSIQKYPKHLAVPGILILAALGLLSYRLLNLVPFGLKENATYLASNSLSAIKNDILFAPIKALQIATLKFSDNDAYIRIGSVAVAIAAALFLYLMLRKWYTVRVSALATTMFITSSWFLHQGRSANLDVLYLTALPVLLLICLWFISKTNAKIFPIAAILLALLLYIPGTWLFIVGSLFIIRKVARKAYEKIPKNTCIFSGAAFLVTLLPLLYSFAIRPSQIVRWLGFNTNRELSVQAIGSNLLDIPRSLFYSGPDDASRWLTGTPIFDVFSVAMIILGLYAFRAGYYPVREKLVFGPLAIAVLLIGLGNVATISLIIPLLYIIIANGLAYMLQSWFTVFPRNPFARSLGIVILAIVVTGSCFYQLQRYYVAWPNAEATTKALLTTER